MSALILPTRRPKSGHRWTAADLAAYRIHVKPASTRTFFGVDELPAATVDKLVLENLDDPGPNPSRVIAGFFTRLRDVPTGPNAPAVEESLTDDFSVWILSLLMEFPTDLQLSIHHRIRSFLMSGKRVQATPDVDIVTRSGRVLLVQENKVRVILFTSIHS